MFREKVKRLHFVGVGGIGMSGLALLMMQMGYTVSGSDIKESRNTQMLKDAGIRVYIGHRPENVEDAQVVVYSSAVSSDNPELVYARSRGIPTIPRGEMLAELFRIKEGVAVCGSHGKTTTTSMIAYILHEAGLDPTVLIGGILQRFNGNARLGKGDFIVSEADESDGSFLKLTPTVAVITNIDREHLDFYKDYDSIRKAFLEFANSVPFYGFSVLNADDEGCSQIIPYVSKKHYTYGIQTEAHLMAKNLRLLEGTYSFDVVWMGKNLGNIHLKVPGKHNVQNALASILVALQMDVSFDVIKEALESFRNAERRLELKGFYKGFPVYDDYGHHPTEIRSVIKAVREMYPDTKILLVFQPHRYSRTYYLLQDFATVLREADSCIVTDIYPAGEENRWHVSAKQLAEISGCIYAPSKEEVFQAVKRLADNHVILFMGAGNIGKWSEEFLEV
ncbi:UDP-N-acetylmuramate/alanine ligase [Thermocrinis albus DSM 14484]|uniref:UDP-N-acetylmuramate--L-alanine ligase n=1 Tax=Thermocrinis albus (strain DSM 14484 / JCM 11386 / HI 11/12) TaxID=638303 RepID=D3SN09_THEAH|nr:UDP-N-acetylmuramate--L-alanine ligase [Thermocrinis albus]ADC90139.1 UDP-N-acetylmuramate/alanine ligase [Thermocrinis albus DSM 14484]